MWGLNYKQSWEQNWCFWTVVLEKTLESPLDCKEIQPVCTKGDQSWVFIGRTDAEAETPVLWPPDAKSWLICCCCCFFFFFFSFIFISWRLITLQKYNGFCHTLTWISLGFTCIPHPDPPSPLPPHPIPLGLPSAPALSTCLMHPTWAGDLFHPR